MKPPAFDYILAESVDMAAAALARAGADAKIIAGGQSLVPMLNFRLLRPSVLVDINRIAGLSFIEETGDAIRIGALTRHYQLETSPVVARHLPVLACAMTHVAHLAIRNRGTIGGSLSHADPAAELPMMAMLLDAELRVASPSGARTVAAREFFVGAMTVDLAADEIVTEIALPKLPPNTGWGFRGSRPPPRRLRARRCGGHSDGVRRHHQASAHRSDRRRPDPAAGDRGGSLVGRPRARRQIGHARHRGRARGDRSRDRSACFVGLPAPSRRRAGGPGRRRRVAARQRERRMSTTREITVTVNGAAHRAAVEPRLLLADFLRHTLGLTGTHVGCEHGVCGACTVLVDGDSARSCLMFAVQADGRNVETVESLGRIGQMNALQESFHEHHALQCGFCTPGMLMTATDLLRKYPLATDDDIRQGLSGNLCRCTGYEHIVRAIRSVVADKPGSGR